MNERWLQLVGSDGTAIAVRVVDVARARNLRLSLGRDGPRLSKPSWLSLHDAATFLDQHRHWLEARLHERQHRRSLVQLPALMRPEACGQMPLRGQATTIVVEDGTRPQLLQADGHVRLIWPEQHPPAPNLIGGLFRRLLDHEMRSDLSTLLGRYTPTLGRAPVRITLRPLQSLWGSLSARDHLSLDLALILAPPPLLEYVLVHELCHLFERNHSARFWARVAKLLPDYRERRQQLQRHGETLKSDLAALLQPNLAVPPPMQLDDAA